MESIFQEPVAVSTNGSATRGMACDLNSISIVVPLYNEREGLAQLLERLFAFQALRAKLGCEFLLIDDGSSDGTADVLDELLASRDNCQVVRHVSNRGIAGAIQTGLARASSECVVSIDSDGSYDLKLLDEMLPRFVPGVDLIVASPYHPQGRVENVSKWRIALSRCASQLYRAVMKQKLNCYTSCFRVYRREKCVGLATHDTGFVGIAEFLWRADLQGLKIIEHPAVLQPRVVGKSKMKLVRSMLGHLMLISTISLSRLLPSSGAFVQVARTQSDSI